jgi:hypothetical protein
MLLPASLSLFRGIYLLGCSLAEVTKATGLVGPAFMVPEAQDRGMKVTAWLRVLVRRGYHCGPGP